MARFGSSRGHSVRSEIMERSGRGDVPQKRVSGLASFREHPGINEANSMGVAIGATLNGETLGGATATAPPTAIANESNICFSFDLKRRTAPFSFRQRKAGCDDGTGNSSHRRSVQEQDVFCDACVWFVFPLRLEPRVLASVCADEIRLCAFKPQCFQLHGKRLARCPSHCSLSHTSSHDLYSHVTPLAILIPQAPRA